MNNQVECTCGRVFAKPHCPICGSHDTQFKIKLQKLFCRQCGHLWSKGTPCNAPLTPIKKDQLEAKERLAEVMSRRNEIDSLPVELREQARAKLRKDILGD